MRKPKIRHKLTRDAFDKARALGVAIARQKLVVAAERDKLRELVEDVESILESVERGEESIDSGLRDLNDGLDAMSEYL